MFTHIYMYMYMYTYNVYTYACIHVLLNGSISRSHLHMVSRHKPVRQVHTQSYIQRTHTQYEYLREPKFRCMDILSKSVATLDMSGKGSHVVLLIELSFNGCPTAATEAGIKHWVTYIQCTCTQIRPAQ